MDDLTHNYWNLSSSLKTLSVPGLKKIRAAIEAFLIFNDFTSSSRLIEEIENSASLHSDIRKEIKLFTLTNPKSFIDLKQIYNLHHDMLIVEEIYPTYSFLRARVSKQQAVKFEGAFQVKLTQLRSVIEDNQNHFLVSIDKQLNEIHPSKRTTEIFEAFDSLRQNQHLTYFSFIKTLTSELKMELYLGIDNNDSFPNYTGFRLQHPLLDQIDTLNTMMEEMKTGIDSMNDRINAMTSYINSKIDTI